MFLELTHPEGELVLRVLRGRLEELRQEIRHAKVSTYSDQLKKTELMLKGVIRKLQDAEATTEIH